MSADAASDGAVVTVVTATRKRPGLVLNAIDSVAGQCCQHVAAHLVLVDDCPDTVEILAGRDLPPHVVVRALARAPHEGTGPARLARLRDAGAELTRTPWIAYLDDDNEWLPHHLHDLLAAATRAGAPAAHSWMRLESAPHVPYLEPRWPWSRTEEARKRRYLEMVRLGVAEIGSNVLRGRAEVGGGADVVRCVDGGEWLLSTDLARTLGFACTFTQEESDAVVGDDDKFLEKVLAHRVPIARSEEATLIYRLGGFSNCFAPDRDVVWVTE